MSKRRITNTAGMVEVKPGKRRRVTNMALMVESELGICVHGGPCSCPFCHETGDANAEGSNPVSLRLGEKREAITDLSVNTPAGTLALTRSYRQGKQGDASYQFMGLGWTHNHHARLIPPVDGQIVVHTPGGGEVAFFLSTTNTYPAAPGSASVVTYNPGTTRYTLTAADKSIMVFDSAGKLLSRTWSSDETWIYSYSGSQLTEVDDGYGRKLVFRYLSGGAHDGQLYRVGDHTFDDTNPSDPTGRYIEFSYDLNQVVDGSGAIVDGSDSLLVGVQDVRGQVWTYAYYAEDGPDADVRQLNFLIARHSPPVNGLGSEIAIEENAYILQGTELAVNGDMEASSDWTGVGSPTHGQSSGQVYTGSFAWHVAAADGEGIAGNTWNLEKDRLYIITARVYPVSGTVQMHVSGETAFDRLSSGTGAWEPLRAVYTPSATINGKTLQFLAAGGAAEFYVDAVAITESDGRVVAISQQRGDAALSTDYSFQPGQDLTTEVRAGLSTQHHFHNGVYLGTEDPDGNYPVRSVDWNYRPSGQVDANGGATWLDWSAGGKNLAGVGDALGSYTSFTYDGSDRLTQSIDAQSRKTTYTYGDANNPRLPTIVKFFDVNGTTVLRWQAFTYDSLGRALTERVIDPADGTTVLQEVVRTYHTSGDGEGLLHTVIQSDIGGSDDVTTTYTYDSAGRVVQTQQSSSFGSCDISYTVFDEAGNVVASICNYDPGMNPDPTDAAAAAALYDSMYPDKNQVTTHVYDALGRRVQTTVNAGASFAQTSVTVYDTLDRVVRTVTNFVDASYDPPADWVFESGVWKDGPSGTTIAHGTDNTANIVADTAYNARGLVRLQRDMLGNVTLLGYNAADRLVKTVQNASDTDYNNDYTGTSPDPDLSAYTPVTDADLDIISEQVYDPNGNRVQSMDALSSNHFTVYDALNRPVKTVRSAKAEATIALNPGEMGYTAANDPRSASYAPSPDPDRDLIHTTEYDALGRVIRAQRLLDNRGAAATWETTLYGYDPLGRQVKLIRSASNPGYNLVVDPDLSEYTPSSASDVDLISRTAYDEAGRTMNTQDVLDSRTWFGYDGLGRQVKTIASAVGTATDGGSSDPRSSSYTPSSAADEDLITRTVYNSDGRVQETADVLGHVTYFVYDGLGRQVRAIRNYVAQGATDPADWAWANDQWEDGASNAIDHGTDNDENILAETIYDVQGRVSSTFDHRHNETRHSYDALGRRIATIQNYGDGTFSAGTPDEDVTSTTAYDVAGRVISTTDNAGIETRFEYDLFGRRVKTIQNYVDGTFSAGTPDEDLISETVYNKAGQVVETTDARGTETGFTYDAAGRRRTVVLAQGTGLETVDYTCYDKAGRVLRTIQNWIDNLTSPDAQDGSGDWLFAPTTHGANNDENLITEFSYDAAGRRASMTDAAGNVSTMTYFKDGQVNTSTDPEAVATALRYDKVRRRRRVVQGYVTNGEDPALWFWDSATDERWEQSNGTAIAHGTENDQNIIVDVTYDKAGRMLSLRDPRGNETTYAYDNLGRRLELTNPLSNTWETAYSDLSSGGTRATQTLPGVNGGASYTVQRDFDRLGRLSSIQYGAPSVTPDIAFGYDAAGSRVRMTEYSGVGFTSPARETLYGYDDVRRLTSVGFDVDADSSVDETVSYEYDAGGLRTQLTLPGSLDVVYTYDALGRLTGITDWDSQAAVLDYDAVGRHIATERDNDFDSTYAYDEAGRLTGLTHEDVSGTPVTLADFAYTVDGRGNRTQAVEQIRKPDTSYDNHTIDYTYDNLSRLIEADYDSGSTIYTYGYDLAGNLVNMDGVTRTFNAANQMTHDGTNSLTYDNNGNLTDDGVNDYTWDRANRLLEVDTGTPAELTAYAYDGVGNRISQAIGTSSPVVTQYLLDTQPGLAKVIAATTGGNTDRYVHAPRGIHAMEDNAGNWTWAIQDAQGSVRAEVDNTLAVLGIQHPDPYGNLFGQQGSIGLPFAYTGEWRDWTGIQNHRARYYNPAMGSWLSLDPFEGVAGRPMSLNGYSWVEGMVINAVDPSGMIGEQPYQYADCLDQILTPDGALAACINRCNSSGVGGHGRLNCIRRCNWPRNQAFEIALEYIQQAYGGFPNPNVYNQENIDCEFSKKIRGVDDFVGLSNVVAEATGNNLDDYLYVMNSIILRYPTSGDASVVVSVGTSRSWADGFCIGSTGLSPEYNDNTPNQISTHIWAFIATGASPHWLSGAVSGTVGNIFHDYVQGLLGDEGASWNDYLVSVVSLTMGYRLRMGNITPKNFGEIFRTNLGGQTSYFDFISCPECRQQAGTIYYSEYLNQLCPIGPGGGGLSGDSWRCLVALPLFTYPNLPQ